MKNAKGMRSGFAMITAIFVIVLMATISVFILDLSGKMVKETSYQYRRAQAKLLALSYTELAVLAVTKYDRTANGKCIEKIDAQINGIDPLTTPLWGSLSDMGYEVNTTIYYIGNNLPCSSSHILNTDSITGNKYQSVGRADQLGAIIVDVSVKYKDPDAPNMTNAPWITYHRRSLQKI